jgi:hypothetical protein
MRIRLAEFMLVAICGSGLVFIPFVPIAVAQTTTPGLTLSNVSGTLARGGQFSGSVTITRLTNQAGSLVADGTISGSTLPGGATLLVNSAPSPTPDDIFAPASAQSALASSMPVAQSFREIPLTLTTPYGGVCTALYLDLGTVFLDQLGVQLDLAQATLDLETMPRANRPLGNLLCAVANLIESSPAGSQAGLLNELLPVVNRALISSQR